MTPRQTGPAIQKKTLQTGPSLSSFLRNRFQYNEISMSKPTRPTTLSIAAHGQTDVGRRRERNEDSFLVNTDLQLYVVADGMGGHLGGGYASRLAVSTIDEVIQRIANDPDVTLENGAALAPDDCPAVLKYAIQTASHRIFAKASEDAALRGMGTTTVALICRDNTAYLANVGDSRGYMVRAGAIKQLTIDHSLVGEQLRAGVLSESDAKGHRLKNIITRSVGFQHAVEIDVETRPLKPGDLFILCTDGLTNMVEDDEILSVVKNNDAKEACQQLIDLANERGGDDNVTVILVHVAATEGAGENNDFEEPTIEL